MLTGVDRVLLRVSSLSAAVAYYRDVLGMPLLREEKRVAAFALAGGIELVLHDSPDLPAQGVYFRVADAKALYNQRESLKLRFATPPSTVTRGHSATVKDPFGNVLLLLDRTREVASEGAPGAAPIESAAAATGTLFSGVEQRAKPNREELITAYQAVGRTADDLPYTHHFESLYDAYGRHFETRPTRQETWRHLLNVRKAGKLPKLGEARSAVPEADDAERGLMRKLMGTNIGKRDRLPYSAAFDELVEAFNKATKRNLTPHQIWRLVATLAK